MSKRKSVIFGSITAGAFLAAGLSVQFSSYNDIALAMQQDIKEEQKAEAPVEKLASDEPQIGSIQLSPGMYIPEQKDRINQEVTKEDVLKTMNLEAIKLSTNSALAEIDAGIAFHLGFKEEQLTPTQVQLYNENVVHYSKLVQSTSKSAIDDSEVEQVLATFTDWVTSYKEAIELSIEEEKEKVVAKEKEDKLLQDVETVDHSPEPSVSKADAISYGIPELGDQYLTYEPYTAITAKTTPHYRLQTLAETDKHGYRIYEGAVSVALGSAYGTTIGTLYDITFADGKVMRAILGDNKSDKHTDELHQYRDATGTYNGESGNIVEIIFDTANYPNMQSVNKKINGDYPAKVVSIIKVGMATGFGQ